MTMTAIMHAFCATEFDSGSLEKATLGIPLLFTFHLETCLAKNRFLIWLALRLPTDTRSFHFLPFFDGSWTISLRYLFRSPLESSNDSLD